MYFKLKPRWRIRFIYFTALINLHKGEPPLLFQRQRSVELAEHRLIEIRAALTLQFSSTGHTSAIHFSTQALKGLGAWRLFA